jgi:hypothetical protein
VVKVQHDQKQKPSVLVFANGEAEHLTGFTFPPPFSCGVVWPSQQFPTVSR